jgi:hypothetical protein
MTRPHRFRFGLLGENVRSATELMETARRAEAAGFATIPPAVMAELEAKWT